MYLCLCKGLTEEDVERVGRAGCVTAEDLLIALDLEDTLCCGRCARDIDQFVAVAECAFAGRQGTPAARPRLPVAPARIGTALNAPGVGSRP